MSPNKIFSSEFEIILFALGTLQPKLQLPKKEGVLNWIKLGNLICKCPLSLGRLSICFANILFCFVSVENFSVWCSPICSFFTFVSLIWRDISRKTLLKSMPKSVLAMFSSRGFMLSGLNIQIFNPFWVCVWVGGCVWCEKWVYFHSFACGHPVFPTPLSFLNGVLCYLQTISDKGLMSSI